MSQPETEIGQSSELTCTPHHGDAHFRTSTEQARRNKKTAIIFAAIILAFMTIPLIITIYG